MKEACSNCRYVAQHEVTALLKTTTSYACRRYPPIVIASTKSIFRHGDNFTTDSRKSIRTAGAANTLRRTRKPTSLDAAQRPRPRT